MKEDSLVVVSMYVEGILGFALLFIEVLALLTLSCYDNLFPHPPTQPFLPN